LFCFFLVLCNTHFPLTFESSELGPLHQLML